MKTVSGAVTSIGRNARQRVVVEPARLGVSVAKELPNLAQESEMIEIEVPEITADLIKSGVLHSTATVDSLKSTDRREPPKEHRQQGRRPLFGG